MRTLAALAAVFILMEGAFGETPVPDQSEFFFTRLIYRSGGFSARFRGSWATDAPAADHKFVWGIRRLTNARVYEPPEDDVQSVGIMDDELFKFPYIYAVEPGQMTLNDAEAARLREYLLRGGFWHCDDFWGKREWNNLETQLAKVFPDRKIERLPLSHEIFHSFFSIDKVIQIPNVSNGERWKLSGGRTPTWERADDKEPGIFGISDDNGRLMVVITYNSDLGDAWEWMDDPDYPAEMTGQAYRMGMNFIIYAMTH